MFGGGFAKVIRAGATGVVLVVVVVVGGSIMHPHEMRAAFLLSPSSMIRCCITVNAAAARATNTEPFCCWCCWCTVLESEGDEERVIQIFETYAVSVVKSTTG